MTGITSIIGSFAKTSFYGITPVSKVLIQYTTVRYRRKPRWLGTAKSKLFRVPERKKQLEDEQNELKRLHNIYRTQMKAVRSFLRDEVEAAKLVSRAGMIIQTPEEEVTEWEDIQKINNEWNQQIGAAREQRLSEEREQRKTFILERLMAKEERDRDRLERVEAHVRQEKEMAASFITLENIDKAIELALLQPVNYNFAIDLNGNIHKKDENVNNSSE